MARAADVIRLHLAERLASIRLGIGDPEADDLPSPLDVERLVIVHVQLSTGGPGDGFRLTYRGDQLVAAEYYYQDWFDSARVALSEDEMDLVESAYATDLTAGAA